MSEIQANKLSPASGTALQVGDSGDTITIPSGATITNSGTATGFGENNEPYWSVMRAEGNGVQSISNETWTKVTFPTTIKDSASGLSNSNATFTIPSGKGGLYFVESSVYFAGGSNDIFSGLKVYINGDPNPLPNNGTTNTNATLQYGANGSSTTNYQVGGSGTFRLNAGDYVEIFVYQNKGSSQNAEPSGTRFSGFRIGDI
tara:strand:+ start:54 stop:659 length:606 start_codon:yes stop_codon:yes gene_type:complete